MAYLREKVNKPPEIIAEKDLMRDLPDTSKTTD
jgi:hypothetical protein